MEAQDDPRFLKGIDEFNQRLFFECHETLEEIWLEEHGEERRFYQGIIQVAAGYFKLEQGVPAGAIKLWHTGLEKLEPYAPVYLGIDVESFVRAVRENLTELKAVQQRGEECTTLNIPLLMRVSCASHSMIRCIYVRKVYRQGNNDIVAVDGVSLDIARGECAVIMGPSGSGKSTLLHLIGGLDRPTSGELLVDQRLVGQMADDQVTLFRRTRIGFVFQFFNLLSTLTALENVALPFVLDGRSKEEAEQRATMLLDKVGLQNRQDHLPEEMSGGEIQRIAVARALAFDPPILLADEPTGNLDSKTGESILSLLRQINHDAGCTIVMVTHSQEAAGYGGRTIFFRDGKVAKESA